MSVEQSIALILHLILAALYVPLLINLIQKHAGHETAAMLLGGYITIASLLDVAEGFWRGGQFQIASRQVANDLQTFSALALAFLLTLTVLSFTRRDMRLWLGIGGAWFLGFILILVNVFRFEYVIWTNGKTAFTFDRLAPTWAMLGWLVFMLASLFIVRSAHGHSRQPLLRNRLNYWMPVFFLVAVNDILIFSGLQIPSNPFRLIAAWLATFIIITHDPPDLVEVSRRVLTYIITTLVIVVFYAGGFSLSQTIFKAMPSYSPLVVGAVIALVLSIIFTPLLSLVRRLVNRWLNIREFHPSRTLHAYSEQISNILDMQRLANVAVGLIIEAMDISRGFLFLVDSELSGEAQKTYRLRAVRNQGERQIKIITLGSDHPVVKHLTQEGRPLLQYDLDLLPAFRSVSSAERDWFNHLEAEVYLPVLSKR